MIQKRIPDIQAVLTLIAAVGIVIAAQTNQVPAMCVMLCILGAGFSFVALLRVIEARRSLKETEFRQLRDVSSENHSPSPELNKLLQTLKNFGYQRLGEVEVRSPNQTAGIVWYLSNPNNFTIAAVSEKAGQANCCFNTIFPDNLIVETSYPYGDKVFNSKYIAKFNHLSLKSTQEQHIKESAPKQKEHGKSLVFTNLSDLLKLETQLRQLRLDNKFKPMIRGYIFNLVATAIISLIFGISFVLIRLNIIHD